MRNRLSPSLSHILIGLGLLGALPVLGGRYAMERRMNRVEIAADLEAVQSAAAQAGLDPRAYIRELRRAGLTSIVVRETTLKRLSDKGYIWVQPLVESLARQRFAPAASPILSKVAAFYQAGVHPARPGDYLILTDRASLCEFLREALAARCASAPLVFKAGNSGALVIEDRTGRLLQTGLGFLEEDLESASSLGLQRVVLHIKSNRLLKRAGIARSLAMAGRFKIKAVILSGGEALGYVPGGRDHIDYTARLFAHYRLTPVIQEKNLAAGEKGLDDSQPGLQKLASALGYKVVKFFTADPAFIRQRETGTASVVDQWIRAVVERDVRMIYLLPLIGAGRTPRENLEETRIAVELLGKNLRRKGFYAGSAEGMGDYNGNRPFFPLLAAGVLGACLCLARHGRTAWARSRIPHLAALVLLIPAAVMAFNGRLWTELSLPLLQFIAFLAAVVFPSLSGLYLVSYLAYRSAPSGRGFSAAAAIRAYAVAMTITLCGGLIATAVLASSPFFLKIEVFRGVKLALYLPLLATIWFYLHRVGLYRDEAGHPLPLVEQGRLLLDAPIRLKYLLAALAAGAALFLIAIRSGNSGLGLLPLENELRTALERLLLARPRTKELVALPLLVIAPWLAMNRRTGWAAPLLILGMLGLTGMINTFIHLRMPLSITLLRVGYSALFGLGAGSILIRLCLRRNPERGPQGRQADSLPAGG